ncbi:hypothetical protein [Rheinheimera pleomorphica]|uniref:hypothetical protein n=1 Tax=Rheinheimera pleomorphica TaxID=2703963 RepID=UPI00141F7E0F|nr:hypothetical protein [Rheinheimera pleomorphica]
MSIASEMLRALKRLIYSDCEWLRSYEIEALTAFYLHLEKADRSKLIRQFEHLDMIQRSPNGKLLQFFDGLDSLRKNWAHDIKIMPDQSVIGFQFSVKKEHSLYLRFVIFLGKGGFGEIQFIRKPELYQPRARKTKEVADLLKAASVVDGLHTVIFEKIISENEEYDLERELDLKP